MKQKKSATSSSKKVAFILIIFGLPLFCPAQDSLAQKIPFPKNIVSVNIMGATPFVGITYQRNLFNRVGLEAGLGYAYSYEAGAKFYFTKLSTNQLNAYVGASYTHWDFLAPFNIVYLSTGLHMSFKSGVVVALGVGPANRYDIMFDKWHWSGWGNLSIGFPF